MRKSHAAIAVTVGALAALGAAAPAMADSSSSPAQTCRATQIPAGPNGEVAPLLGMPGVPFSGYFYRMGGCASSLAHGALDNSGANLSALTTQAGYVQTCQAITAAEGSWDGLAAEASAILNTPTTIANLNQCTDVLKAVHLAPPPPM